MRNTFLRVLSVILILTLVTTIMPSMPAYAAQPETLSVENGNIEVIVSTQNGGFLIRTLEGDVIAKDDDNKDLLYRNDDFDTSFTSFEVTSGGGTKEYIFGSDYSFLGLGGNNLSVARTDTGIKAVWTVDDLTFTQLLEPVSNVSSHEHGTVKISYSVVNGKGSAVSVKARLLMDTALGKQDHAFYELAESSVIGGYNRVEKEQMLNEAEGDFIPANFFAYDNYENPTIAAYTIHDVSPDAIRPYQIAFGHWNNLAATIFDFMPDGDLTFTNAYNKKYLTADSAVALYYDLGTVTAGDQSNLLYTYYGVDSKIRVKDSDQVGITVTSPLSLDLNEDKTAYLAPQPGLDHGTFDITTNITNLAREGSKDYEKIAVAVLVDDGLMPLDNGGNTIIPEPNNKYPYYVEVGGLDVGAIKQLTWKIKAEVLSKTSYRKIVFRAYDMTDRDDNLLVLDNLIGSSTTYVLCPGGEGELPQITFTSADPKVIYNQGSRHLYLTGTGFNLLEATDAYELRAYLKSDRSKFYVIPATNILFPPEPGVLDIVLKDTMPTGEYELVFEWQTPIAGIDQNLTAPALSFMVTANPAYRNNYYNIVAIVKEGNDPNIKYSIKTFANEEAFTAFTGEVLLVFKGEFTVTAENAGVIQACSATSTSEKDTININGALDFENGNVQIYQGSSGGTQFIMVEFDGDLYTTNSRTAVWSGNASITPLNNGSDYGLIKYDERGERIFGEQPQNIISLVWPSGLNMLQTLGGLAVDFRYGQFGAMYGGDDDDILMGYVVSFGGKLDMSFLMPGGVNQAQKLEREEYEKRQADSEESEVRDGNLYEKTNHYSPSDEAKAEDEKNKVTPVGKVNIEDILFGINKGYLGFNSEVEVMLPKYVDALPSMGGKLSINTIGGYQVGVLGKTKTERFELEFELNVKSAPRSGTPVPDKIYFFMGGFEPGINIDGAGAVWLTGLGGGIDNLYDTIFSNGGITPLTLLLSASFDIIKVLSGRADMALSLRGFQLEVSDVKLKNTEVVVIDSGQLSVEWIPDFYLHIAAFIELYEVIGGNAYIIVDDDFFEFFLRANINIPEDVAIIGGMTVANTDLGGNNDKLWGAVSALGIRLGLTYYWGGDVHFGTGSNTASPTYPELLGFEDVPVGVNAETGKTLYMRVGTNLSEGTAAQIVEVLDTDGLVLMSVEPTLTSDFEKKNHSLNLGTDSGDDAALTIRFTGDDRPKTIGEAKEALFISKPSDAGEYALTFYNGTNPDTANANLMVDDEKNTTTIGMTITDYIAGEWSLVTTQQADIVLYSVGAMPEVTTFTAGKNAETGNLDLTWTGSKLDQTELSIYVTSDIGSEGTDDAGEMGTWIGSIGGINADGTPKPAPSESGQTASFALPDDLQSGSYYVRMIASCEDEVNQTIVATDGEGGIFNHPHVNVDQPGAPGGLSLQNSGNNMLKVSVGSLPTGDFDGYVVSLYESTEDSLIPTDFMGIGFEKEEDGTLPEMVLGGTYFTTDGKAYGLTAGKNYVAKVAAYKINTKDTPDDASDDVMIFGTEAVSGMETLIAATPPVITFEADPATTKTLSKTVATGSGTFETLQVETFTSNDVSFTLESDVPVTGYWSIDGILSQDLFDLSSTGINQVTETDSISISKNLSDGEHTISFMGWDAEGDSVTFSKFFAVDTVPPRLMLTSPVNGGFFSEEGSLLIEGLGDEDARYTFVVDGVTRVEKQTLASLDAAPDPYGLFSYELSVDPGVSSHHIMIIATDAAGNSVSTTATVKNIGLGSIKSIGVLKDGLIYSNKNISLLPTGNTTAQLQLFATTENGSQFVIKDENLVHWSAMAREGSASVGHDGSLTVNSGSVGYVEGGYRVSDRSSMTGAITFGAEIFSESLNRLMLASNIGGSATGEGIYAAGATVTLTATPASGYRFSGWRSSNGGSFSNASTAITTFTMPDNDTVVTAFFSHISSSTPGSSGYEVGQVYANEGTLASMNLSAEMAANPNLVVPYYLSGDQKILAKFSCVINGRLVFIAPQSTTYYAEQKPIGFTDILEHEAKDSIEFTAARELFVGDGNQIFDPLGKMTRAMFATVIAKLDGVDLTHTVASNFDDVSPGSWYNNPVGWATKAGIVSGFSATEFRPNAPVTREQMAVMLNNYLAYKGYQLKGSEDNFEPSKDHHAIASWAQDATEMMLRLGIIDVDQKALFNPKAELSRSEGSTLFHRFIEAILRLRQSEHR